MDELIAVLNAKERKILEQINIQSDDLLDIEDQIANYLLYHCVDDSGNELTEEGIILEEILNKMGDL